MLRVFIIMGELHVNNSILQEDGDFSVDVTFSLTSIKEGEQILQAKVIYSGVFKMEPGAEIPFLNFCKVNAPAIIYPFVREHMANLIYKAGLGNLYIPPVNFMAMQPSEEQLTEKTK